MNSPGQSGVPGNPHYSNLFEGWVANAAFPLLYTRQKVEEALQERIVLQPKQR